MLLKLKNVGRLQPIEVKIDGLTVICGNNNTGKSTIGKILYCIYNTFYDIDNNIRREKEELIYSNLRAHNPDRGLYFKFSIEDSLKELLDIKPDSEKELQRISY